MHYFTFVTCARLVYVFLITKTPKVIFLETIKTLKTLNTKTLKLKSLRLKEEVLHITPNFWGTEEISVNHWEKSNLHYFLEKITNFVCKFKSNALLFQLLEKSYLIM